MHFVFLRNSGSLHSSGSFGSGVSSLNLQYSYQQRECTAPRTPQHGPTILLISSIAADMFVAWKPIVA